MATLDQLQDALIKADAAGNVDDARAFADEIRKMRGTTQATPEPSMMQSIKQGAGNLAAGAVRGAGSIGQTILSAGELLPSRMIPRVAAGGNILPDMQADAKARQGMDAGLQSMGAEPESMMYKGGKLAGEIAGTAGTGNVLATLAKGAGASAPVINALQSGGMVTGGGQTLGKELLTRSLAGAGVGAAQTAMVNPDLKDVGMGAALGGGLPIATKVAGAAGSMLKNGAAGITNNLLGLSTGAGSEAVRTAYQSGKKGATGFLDNMRGDVPMTDVLDSAKSALGQMRLDRAAQYRGGMAGVATDKTVIDFAPIDKAVSAIQSMGNYKGQVINKNSAGVVDEISGLVNQWKGLNPAEYHTPEGLDALKQAISDVRDTTQFGTAARKAADTAYNAVKGEITAQAPTYAKVMKDYSQASETLAEVERALSLGNKAAADTSMRKLQSLMRNNVNTNFGNRLGLAKTLEENGAEIIPSVAGQAMSSWTPRGLQGATNGAALLAAYPTGGASLAALPITSPRLVGEMAYKLGSANRGLSNAGSATANRLAQLVGRNGSTPLTMNQLAPLLATIPVMAANQR